MPTGKARIVITPAVAQTEDKPPSMRPHSFRLIAANDVVLVQSENYATKASARRAAVALLEACKEIMRLGAFGVVWPPHPPRIIDEEDAHDSRI